MKNKLTLLIPVLIIVSLILAISFYNSLSFSLISPVFNQNHPLDLTNKLKQKNSSPPLLDYTTSTQNPVIPNTVSYLVYHAISGVVYSSNNQNSVIAPASFTKLITTMVALDLASIDQLLTATSDSINKEPTILGLKEGEQLNVSELVRAAIATSANDAAATLGEGVAKLYGQNIDFFITQMNKKASIMNMNHTHFTNSEGYDDDNQYSTLEDLVLLIHNAQQNYPEIINAGFPDRKDLAMTTTHGFYYLPNWNGLLGLYPGVNGLKIAYTKKAGYSTIVTTKRDEIPINLILVGAQTLKERDLYASILLDSAYARENLTRVNLTEEQLHSRYDAWNELAKKIKAELKKNEL